MPTYTTTSLISGVKEKILVPTSQALFTNTDFQTLLTKELHDRVVPFYMKEREDFFITTTDVDWHTDPDDKA